MSYQAKDKLKNILLKLEKIKKKQLEKYIDLKKMYDEAEKILNKAIETAERIKYGHLRSETLANIAMALAKAGRYDEAEKIIDKTVETTEKIGDHYLRSETLANIAMALAKAGKLDKAEKILNKAIETAERIKYDYLRSETLANIAMASAEIQGIKIMRKIEDRMKTLYDFLNYLDFYTVPELAIDIDLDYINNLMDFLEAISRLNKKIRDIIDSKPDLRIKMLNRIVESKNPILKLEILNEGYAHAYNLKIDLDGIEYSDIMSGTSVVRGMEKRIVEIPVKPYTTGEIPIKIYLDYMDGWNNKYTKTFNETILIRSGPKAVEKRRVIAGFPSELSNKYSDVEYIGRGGFARVYKAKRVDGLTVAIKIPISLDETSGKVFIRELTNWIRFDHMNIVKVYDFNILPIPYFEMEMSIHIFLSMEKVGSLFLQNVSQLYITF